LLSSGIVAYLGPFTAAFRKDIIDEWIVYAGEVLKMSQHYSLTSALGDPVKIRSWNIDGLPRDTFSIENAIIIEKNNRWPLLIDPQGQANKWVRNMFKNEENETASIYIFKPTAENYMKIL
jgi:dynein heavy chain